MGQKTLKPLALLFFFAQICAFLVHAVMVYDRGALSYDTALYGQAWYLISRGNFDPYSSVGGFPFLGNHLELIIYALAPFALISASPLTLLVIQCLCLGAAEFVSYCLAEAVIGNYALSPQMRQALRVAALALLLLNPFIFSSVAGDFHLEAVTALFFSLTAYLLWLNRPIWLAFAFLTVACGDVAASWLFFLGAGAALKPGLRKKGLLAMLTGALAFAVIVAAGGDRSLSLSEGYGYLRSGPGNLGILAGFFLHLPRVFKQLLLVRSDAYASLIVSGVGAILEPLTLPLMVGVGLENLLNAYRQGVFAQPGFVYLPLYLLGPAGTVSALARVAPRPRLAASAAALCVLPCAGFFASFYSSTWGSTLQLSHLTEAQVSYLRNLGSQAGAMVVSQGLAGNFIEDRYLVALRNATRAKAPRKVDLCLDPYDGIETLSAYSSALILNYVAERYPSKVLYAHEGLICIRVRTDGALALLPSPLGAPGGAFRSDFEDRVLSPFFLLWNARGGGYALWGVYFRAEEGLYRISLQISNSKPVEVQVWDDSTGREMSLTDFPPGSLRSVYAYVRLTSYARPSSLQGTAPFSARFAPPPPGDVLEVRIYVSSGGLGEVGLVKIKKLSLPKTAG